MRHRAVLCTIGGAVLALVWAAPASGAHHLVKISEVSAGTAANPGGEFVELQLPAAGENSVAGQASVSLYDAAGTETNAVTFAANPPNGQSQRTMLVATAAAGVAPDLTLPAGDALNPAGGSACFLSSTFGNLDCVAWGTSTATTPSPSGTPAPAIPDGSSLTRSIARGCATLLEVADDTNDSAADFAATAPTPRNNSTAPTETTCGGGGDDGGGGGGGGGAGDDSKAPNTKIKKGPKGEVDTDTVTVKFKSTEKGSSFECKLDRKKYKRCSSPKKLKNLDDGKHKFKVRATDSAGNTDSSPAKLKFRVDAR
jgi:hypothetical protein